MALWRRGGFADNTWTTLADGEPIPASGAIIVSAARWSAERETLISRADPFGVAISPGKDAEQQLREAALAQVLRRRYGFAGELRAGGDVLLDEISLMLRCGFDSFEITHEPTLRALEGGRLPGLSLYYQPSLAPHEVPVGTRPWLRRAAGE
jgi:uncharacterized protein (DUF934 family)